jgi:hypothetical protein
MRQISVTVQSNEDGVISATMTVRGFFLETAFTSALIADPGFKPVLASDLKMVAERLIDAAVNAEFEEIVDELVNGRGTETPKGIRG